MFVSTDDSNIRDVRESTDTVKLDLFNHDNQFSPSVARVTRSEFTTNDISYSRGDMDMKDNNLTDVDRIDGGGDAVHIQDQLDVDGNDITHVQDFVNYDDDVNLVLDRNKELAGETFNVIRNDAPGGPNADMIFSTSRDETFIWSETANSTRMKDIRMDKEDFTFLLDKDDNLGGESLPSRVIVSQMELTRTNSWSSAIRI